MHTSPSALREGGAGLRGSARRSWSTLLVVLLGVPLGLCTHQGSQTMDGEAREDFGPPTPNVHVALHLDETLAPNRTVVWTAAFQAAWDRLADTLGMPEGISLSAPAQVKAVRALNAGRLEPGVLDPADLTVIAGPATEATWGAIGQDSDRPRPEAAPPSSSQDVVAFARLKASLRYEVPFFVREKPLHFGPERLPVKAWGLRKSAYGDVADRMREQVLIHVPVDAPEGDAAQTGVVVITAAGGKRVVVSGRPARATLRQTWQDAAAVIASAPAQTFSSVTRLTIPRVAIVAGRAYSEIAPAGFEGSDATLVLARQDLSLLVDERGADVDAEAVVVAVGALPVEVDIDGPFLVALLVPGSEMPFVLAWIGSGDGLTPWNAAVGRALSAIEARPFVGTWALDRKASIDATYAAFRRVLGPEGTRWASVKRENVAGLFKDRQFVLNVSADGSARVRTTREESPQEEGSEARMTRDGARTLLGMRKADEGGHETWDVSRDGDRLRLHFRSRSEVLVLRRE